MPKPWAHGRPPSGSSLPPSALTRRFGVLLALVGVSLWLCLLGASYSSRPGANLEIIKTGKQQAHILGLCPAGPIITLASSSQRLNTTLPVAVSSLLSQSLPPSSINVYLPLEDRATVDLDALHPVFSHPTVHLSFVEDVGPSTKFIPMLRSLLDQGPPGLDKQVIVVDDDHAYSSELVRTLVRGFEREKGSVAVGLRGWRVREDCKWGVGPDELARHVVEGWKISAPYKVGVLTANEVRQEPRLREKLKGEHGGTDRSSNASQGYLVTPRMFVPPVELAQPDRTSFSSPLFDYDTPVPVAAHLVDDIW